MKHKKTFVDLDLVGDTTKPIHRPKLDEQVDFYHCWECCGVLFVTEDLVKSSVALSYQKWTAKPRIVEESATHIVWAVADGTEIHAVLRRIYRIPDHL